MTLAVRDGHGRPLRFLGVVAAAWIGLRTAMLWPVPELPAATIGAPRVPAKSPPIAVAMTARIDAPDRGVDQRTDRLASASGVTVRMRPRPALPSDLANVAHAAAAVVRQRGDSATAPGSAEASALPLAPPSNVPPFVVPNGPSVRHRQTDRWSASAWAVARFGAGVAPTPVGGQLGGSQAGLRIVRTLDRRGRIAVAGRMTSPLGDGLREASLGLEWQPTRLPVKLVAEHRFALGAGKGARGGPGVALIGGFGPTAIGEGVLVETYGQAGVIRRVRTEPYADAAVRVARPAGTLGAVRFDLGAGAWGGAQRGAARLDVGPSGSISVPLRRASLRLTLDWRERVAGAARPGSGPALTLGTDF